MDLSKGKIKTINYYEELCNVVEEYEKTGVCIKLEGEHKHDLKV